MATENTSYMKAHYSILALKHLSPLEKLVYMHLLNDCVFYKKEKGYYAPSVKNIADKLGTSSRSITRALGALESKGVLLVESRMAGHTKHFNVVLPSVADKLLNEELDISSLLDEHFCAPLETPLRASEKTSDEVVHMHPQLEKVVLETIQKLSVQHGNCIEHNTTVSTKKMYEELTDHGVYIHPHSSDVEIKMQYENFKSEQLAHSRGY